MGSLQMYADCAADVDLGVSGHRKSLLEWPRFGCPPTPKSTSVAQSAYICRDPMECRLRGTSARCVQAGVCCPPQSGQGAPCTLPTSPVFGAQVPTCRPLRHLTPPGIPPDPGTPQTQAPGGPLGALRTGMGEFSIQGARAGFLLTPFTYVGSVPGKTTGQTHGRKSTGKLTALVREGSWGSWGDFRDRPWAGRSECTVKKTENPNAPKVTPPVVPKVHGGGSGQPGGSRSRVFVRLTHRGGAGGLVGSGTLSGKPVPGSRDLIPTCALRRLRFAGRKQFSPCNLVRFRPELRTRRSDLSTILSMVLETLFPANFRIRAAGVCYSLSLVRFCDVCTHCYYCYGYRYGYGALCCSCNPSASGGDPSGAGSHCAGSTDAWQRPGLAQGRSAPVKTTPPAAPTGAGVQEKPAAVQAVGPEDLPSDEAKDLADAGAEFNDAAMNDGEPLPGELPEEGGDELPAPEEQDVVSADDLDLFAPKVLAKVPDLLTEAVKPGRAAVQHEPLPRSAIISLCRMYPSLPYDLNPLGAPEVERILVGFEGRAVLLRRVLVSALSQMVAPEADAEKVGRAIRHASQLTEYLLSAIERTRKQRLVPFVRPSVMLASAPKGIDDTTDMRPGNEDRPNSGAGYSPGCCICGLVIYPPCWNSTSPAAW
ncbi:hypothetical protein PAPYR_8775 [Paratrimastix pyriformis]|uniref:Uncharacterized protein n=1 Tax=Paratrimastix pyriformis TaxID=342808 RepID=A0ABQ8U9U1_9EUKA|nr:hypothetical protein PAPYR_8775 [Paratrimastix pyriformis]